MANQFATKEDLNYAAQKQKELFQKKEAGKSLVENTEITKLGTVEENAQENIIEAVTLNGEAVEVNGKAINLSVITGEEVDSKIGVAITNANVDGKIEAAITNANVDGKIAAAFEEADIDGKIKTAVAGVYKVKGSVTLETLPTEGVEEGHVYNVTEAFTTTDDFVEGAGVEYPAGTNVVYTESGKWDCMAGTYDFSDFVKSSDIVEITEAEIDAMYAE